MNPGEVDEDIVVGVCAELFQGRRHIKVTGRRNFELQGFDTTGLEPCRLHENTGVIDG